MEPANIIIDPEIMDGLPILQGTRFPVYIIIEMLEEGSSFEDIKQEYPFLSNEQIKSAIHYAAQLVAEPTLTGTVALN
ncbi:MAG: DUF433 domain-containing protein [Ignavibacteriae bacterium]|nr:DUF433 domain-containing protein [Ignavibacteriota bacterium]